MIPIRFNPGDIPVHAYMHTCILKRDITGTEICGAGKLNSGKNHPSTSPDEWRGNFVRTELTLTFRFIPNREGQDLQAAFSLLHDDSSPATPSRQKKRTPHGELHFQRSKWNICYPNFMHGLTAIQLKKPIVLSQLCFVQNYSTIPFHNQHHQTSRQMALCTTTQHTQQLSMTPHDLIHLLIMQLIWRCRPR